MPSIATRSHGVCPVGVRLQKRRSKQEDRSVLKIKDAVVGRFQPDASNQLRPRQRSSRRAVTSIGRERNAIVGERHEHEECHEDRLQVCDHYRICIFSVCHDGRIFGASWTDRAPWPLLHDLGHRRLRLQLYEL